MATVVIVLTIFLSLVAVGVGRECPPWFEWVNSTSDSSGYCACAPALGNHIICNQKSQQSFLISGSCVFYDTKTDCVMTTECRFLFPKGVLENNILFPLPKNVSDLNEAVCGNLSREVKRPFCGRCTNDTGPSVYSIGIECVHCTPVNILYYLLLQYLPVSFLFLVVLVFRLNVTAAPMAHYVLFCHLTVMVSRYFIHIYTKLSGAYLIFTLFAVWSFDPLLFISPPLCISRHMEEIYLPFLEFLAVIYPFFLLLLTYIAIELHAMNCRPVVALWRPFHRVYVKFYRSWDPSSTMIQAFSSLFFLSYARLTTIIWAPFVLHARFDSKGIVQEKSVVYIDPNVPYLSEKHIILIVFSVCVAVFLYLPPILLLVVYPTSLYRKMNHWINPQWRIGIKTYVDTFQGCLKDGTDGTWDYRAVPGYLLAMLGFVTPLAQYMMMSFFPQVFSSNNNSILFFAAMAMFFLLIQPYKRRIANLSIVMLSTIAALYASFSAKLDISPLDHEAQVIICILLLSPHFGFVCYIIWKIMKIIVIRYFKYEDREAEGLLDGSVTLNQRSLSDTA